MMRRATFIQIICIVVCIACLIGASLLVPSLDRMRQQQQIDDQLQFDERTPWHVQVLTASLGAFRGLAVDVLWQRANRLKEEGKLYEANQLAQWICDLQPRFPMVWRFQAWNNAYNISVMTHTPDERWYWVQSGVTLLRDRGIRWNRRAVPLYRELAWIFFHKIGQFSDDMHWYYKRQMARQWQELLGLPTQAATGKEAAERFKRIVDAPDTLKQLIDEQPEVQQLVDAVRALDYPLDEGLLREIGKVLMFNYASSPLQLIDAQLQSTDEYAIELAELLQDPQLVLWADPLLSQLRKRALIDGYNMDPVFMHELMESFGPIDWRHPAAHAIYWGAMAVEMAAQRRVKTDIDLLNTDRQIIHGFQNLMYYGRLEYEPVSSVLDMMPDPRFFPAYDKALDEARARLESGDFGDQTSESFDSGHENFLLRALTMSYFYGDEEQARNYYKKLRDLYGDKPHNIRWGRYQLSLDELARQEWAENSDLKSDTLQFVNAMLNHAFGRGLALGRRDVFDRFVKASEVALANYQADKRVTPTAPQHRLYWRPFDELLADEYAVYVTSPHVPLLIRVRVWANAPLKLNQQVFDRIQQRLHQQVDAAADSFDPVRAFPEPPGMEQVRQSQQAAQTDQIVPVEIERQ